MLDCCCVAPMAAPKGKRCHDADFARHFDRSCRHRRVGRADAAGWQRLCRRRRSACRPRPASLRCRWRPVLELRHAAGASSARSRHPRRSRSASASPPLALAADSVSRSWLPLPQANAQRFVSHIRRALEHRGAARRAAARHVPRARAILMPRSRVGLPAFETAAGAACPTLSRC